MYQTVLRSVNGYTAIGANGEKLQFVGNWYGSAGDTVWTDGNIIFGHSPLRASSTLMILPANSGIPVLCDNLRGYFSPAGAWNSYDVAQKDWIINNENDFQGGSAEYNGATVLDAEISKDNNTYILTWDNARGWIGGISEWNYGNITFAEIFSNYPVTIYKDGKIIDTIDLSEFVTKLDDEAKKIHQAIKNTVNEYEVGFKFDRVGEHAEPSSIIVEIQAPNFNLDGNYDYYVFGSAQYVITEETRDYTTAVDDDGVVGINHWINHIYYITYFYSFLYHIENGNKRKVAYHYYSTRTDDEKSANYVFQQNLGDGSFTMNKYGLISFYDSDSRLIAKDIIVAENFCHIEITSYTERDEYDSSTTYTVNYNIYTPDGKVISKSGTGNDTTAGKGKYDPNFPDLGIPIMEGFFLKDADGILRPFYFKPILKKLSDTVYLFGTHGGKLYIKTKSGIQEIGDGLKNFRLEVLNDISKAKG